MCVGSSGIRVFGVGSMCVLGVVHYGVYLESVQCVL